MAPSRRNASGRLLLLPREDYSPLPSHSPRDSSPALCSLGSMHPDSPSGVSSSADRKVPACRPVGVSMATCASPSEALKAPQRPLRSTLSAPSSASGTGICARIRRAGNAANAPSISLPNRPATQNPFEQMPDGADTPTPLPVSFGGFGSLFPPSSATGGSPSGTAQVGRPATAHGRFAGGGGRSLCETPWYEPRGPPPGAAEPARSLVIDTLGGMPPWCTPSASEKALPGEVKYEERDEFSASEGSSSDGGQGSSPASSSDSEDSIAWKTGGGSSFSSLEAVSSTQWLFGNWLLWWPEEGKRNRVEGMTVLSPENKKFSV